MFSPNFEITKGNKTINGAEYFFSIIQQIGEPKIIPKGKTIIRMGSQATFFFYINSGIFKSSVTVNEKKYILGFTFPGDVDGCPPGLLQTGKNNFAIEAVTEAEVLICELTDFKKACSEAEYYKIINNLLVYYLSIIEKRLVDAISLTAEKRYHQLVQELPEKIKQIPLSHLAAYLGITKERLSRIRQKVKN